MITENSKLMVCPDCCKEHGSLWRPWIQGDQEQYEHNCSNCGKPMIVTNITHGEAKIISKISTDWDFYKAMMKLKEDDIIEFKMKLSQVPKPKNTTVKKQEPDNRPKCPKCGSTSITAGARGVSGFWGFIGASKTVNRCANCGYTWKPGR